MRTRKEIVLEVGGVLAVVFTILVIFGVVFMNPILVVVGIALGVLALFAILYGFSSDTP